MTDLKVLVEHIDQLLRITKFKDYCPNGLQVEGCPQVGRIVGGVTASQELIEKAIELKADVVLVHHGYFWRGEKEAIAGMKKQRIKSLLEHDISLLAYHLPLDAHPELGNNAQLANLLEFEYEGDLNRDGVGAYGRLKQPMLATELAQLITARLDRDVVHITSPDSEHIETIAWCTGGAQNYIAQAVDLGVDAYVSGEISESTVHTAKETGVHYFSAGHHATERYGVKALGEHLADKFGLEFEFVDLWNPV